MGSKNIVSSNPPQKAVRKFQSQFRGNVGIGTDEIPFRPTGSQRNVTVCNVIIVDDNRTVRKALREFFAIAGFSVCGEAENGREAIEKAKQLHPDLIVTDLAMPVMNGLEEARLLKQIMPTVPVIIYTVHSGPSFEKEARLAGASAVVSKSEAVATLIAKATALANKVAA